MKLQLSVVFTIRNEDIRHFLVSNIELAVFILFEKVWN